jgi:SAM-dependent methyltransferase
MGDAVEPASVDFAFASNVFEHLRGPDALLEVLAAIREALRPGGVFAGELFGPHDEWAGRSGMSFHDRSQVEGMLAGMDVVQLVEDDRRGMSFEGPKHWHVFHIVARA